jgi:hypothetical protein
VASLAAREVHREIATPWGVVPDVDDFSALYRILPGVLVMLVFGGYAFWMMSRRKTAIANIGPQLRMFFERTGYRYADMAQAPVEAQVARAEQQIQGMYGGGAFEQNLVRDFYGITVVHAQYMGPARDGSNAYVRSCSWRVPFGRPPRVGIQIADAYLDSVGKAVREAFSNSRRIWRAEFPNRVPTGDAEIDRRFVVYAIDANAARAVLAAPGLRELLLSCAEVDVAVRPNGITFADPEQKNVVAAMGGMVGQMAVGFDFGKMFELTMPVHDRIAQILGLVARAAQ